MGAIPGATRPSDSQSFGQVPSTGDGTLGDLDDALAQLRAHQDVLRHRNAVLVELVHEAILCWDDRPADRLVQLMPLLDALAAIAGATLPLQVPPTT